MGYVSLPEGIYIYMPCPCLIVQISVASLTVTFEVRRAFDSNLGAWVSGVLGFFRGR